MTINTLRIENVKGFSDKVFELNIIPNRPSLLVAPNGFGKSSLAAAFLSLQQNKLSVPEDYFHRNDPSLNSKISIDYTDSDSNEHHLEADDTLNTINDHFSWFIINNQIKAKGVGRNFGGRTAVSASIAVEPVVLVETIPERADFSYSFRGQKQAFGRSGKILPNIGTNFRNPSFTKKLASYYGFLDRVSQARNTDKLTRITNEINARHNESANAIRDWVNQNKIEDLSSIEPLREIAALISSSNLGVNSEGIAYLAAIQIHHVYMADKSGFKKAVKYSDYLCDKNDYKEMLSAFNSSWCQIIPKEKQRKLLVEFPKTHHVSNGQRDVITFVALLNRAMKKLKGQRSILIIDEVFDYLDDANLVAVQYYITKLIDKFKAEGRIIYPLIMTHLNPYYFKN